MEAVIDGRVKFFPERYAQTYLDWLAEKRDWGISRQLWWGHRIPVWTLKDLGGSLEEVKRRLGHLKELKSKHPDRLVIRNAETGDTASGPDGQELRSFQFLA